MAQDLETIAKYIAQETREKFYFGSPDQIESYFDLTKRRTALKNDDQLHQDFVNQKVYGLSIGERIQKAYPIICKFHSGTSRIQAYWAFIKLSNSKLCNVHLVAVGYMYLHSFVKKHYLLLLGDATKDSAIFYDPVGNEYYSVSDLNSSLHYAHRFGNEMQIIFSRSRNHAVTKNKIYHLKFSSNIADQISSIEKEAALAEKKEAWKIAVQCYQQLITITKNANGEKAEYCLLRLYYCLGNAYLELSLANIAKENLETKDLKLQEAIYFLECSINIFSQSFFKNDRLSFWKLKYQYAKSLFDYFGGDLSRSAKQLEELRSNCQRFMLTKAKLEEKNYASRLTKIIQIQLLDITEKIKQHASYQSLSFVC